MTHSPIRPGTSVIHLCDVCSLDEIFDAAGQSQGLFLIWKLAEDFDHPESKAQSVRVGQRLNGKGLKPDTAVSVKALLHPISGVDHVVVVRHDGTLIECATRGKRSDIACGDRVNIQHSGDNSGAISFTVSIVPEPATWALLIAGFAFSAVSGMLYKIVPFLTWYHLQDLRNVSGRKPPTINQIIPERQ